VAEGASVVIGGLRELEGRELASRLGAPVRFVLADVTVESDVERLISHTVDSGAFLVASLRAPTLTMRFGRSLVAVSWLLPVRRGVKLETLTPAMAANGRDEQ